MTTSLRMLIGVMLGGLLPALATAQSVTYDYRPAPGLLSPEDLYLQGRSQVRQPVR